MWHLEGERKNDRAVGKIFMCRNRWKNTVSLVWGTQIGLRFECRQMKEHSRIEAKSRWILYPQQTVQFRLTAHIESP